MLEILLSVAVASDWAREPPPPWPVVGLRIAFLSPCTFASVFFVSVYRHVIFPYLYFPDVHQFFFFSNVPWNFLQWPERYTDLRQLSGISRNSGKIPRNLRRTITDFGKMSAKFIKTSESSPKFCGMVGETAKFDFGAVQKLESNMEIGLEKNTQNIPTKKLCKRWKRK